MRIRTMRPGLKSGALCPVFMTSKTSQALVRYPIDHRCIIETRSRVKICGMTFEAFPLEHSLIAPAVGWRVSVGPSRFFYSPDVVLIHQAATALRDVSVYIDDGATLVRSLVRKRTGYLIGHASIQQQLNWCAKYGVRRAVFTHCGSQIVTGDEDKLMIKLRTLADDLGVKSQIAYDGMTIILR